MGMYQEIKSVVCPVLNLERLVLCVDHFLTHKQIPTPKLMAQHYESIFFPTPPIFAPTIQNLNPTKLHILTNAFPGEKFLLSDDNRVILHQTAKNIDVIKSVLALRDSK